MPGVSEACEYMRMHIHMPGGVLHWLSCWHDADMHMERIMCLACSKWLPQVAACLVCMLQHTVMHAHLVCALLLLVFERLVVLSVAKHWCALL